jgi:putative methionine-R-sulfoxide reductase with GAF domain
MSPVLEEEALLALLYVDSQEPHFCDSHDLERLSKFSRIVAKSVHDSDSPRPVGGTTES